jgi:tetratricopeptide (TPR) repeat protein
MNAFSQATDINPEFVNAWFNKSLALIHLGKDTEALRALDRVLKLKPRDKEAQSQRALIVRKMSEVSDNAENGFTFGAVSIAGIMLDKRGAIENGGVRGDSLLITHPLLWYRMPCSTE